MSSSFVVIQSVVTAQPVCCQSTLTFALVGFNTNCSHNTWGTVRAFRPFHRVSTDIPGAIEAKEDKITFCLIYI